MFGAVAFAQRGGANVESANVRNGEILFFNLDSVYAHYILVETLNDEIESETDKQFSIFQKRQADFQQKYDQFQQNYQAGVLTQSQVEEAQQQLSQEYDKISADYESAMDYLDVRKNEISKKITDSIANAVKRINAKRNASYVLVYQYGGFLYDPDPSKDITNELIEMLNEPFNTEKKRK